MAADRDEPGPPRGAVRGRPTFEPNEGALVGDKYRLERSLAGGGMGSVWVARHVKLDARVAIKFIARELLGTPSALARFEREAKASAQLSSPHVVKVHDFGIEDGMPFMVMELLEGEDLGTRFDRVGRLSLGEAADVAVAVGKALRAAHDVGLVHRDLKPRNIFLATQGGETVIKLLDFGIARETKTQLVEDRTSSGLVLGSPYHMAPEQAQGLEVDHRADLWALGVVLYRALTGRRPFEGESVTLVLFAICTKKHPAPSSIRGELPIELDAFHDRALSKSPEGRFESATEMVSAFLDALGRPRAGVDDRSASGARSPASGALRPLEEPVSGRTPSSGTGEIVGRVDVTKSRAVPLPTADPPGSTSGAEAGNVAPISKDLSGSRALSAVSTGVVPIHVVSSFTRRVLIAVAIVAGVLVAFLVFRGGAGTGGATSAKGVAAPPPAPSVPDVGASAQVGQGGPPSTTSSPSGSAPGSPPAIEPLAPAPSSSSGPPASVPTGPSRPAARPSAPPAGTSKVGRPAGATKIDPFTGLPVGP